MTETDETAIILLTGIQFGAIATRGGRGGRPPMVSPARRCR